MAAGAFVSGSSIELTQTAPKRLCGLFQGGRPGPMQNSAY
ncbi:MAG: hypothetical protein ACLVLH_20020 [Eisenbergiella massiliensis]